MADNQSLNDYKTYDPPKEDPPPESLLEKMKVVCRNMGYFGVTAVACLLALLLVLQAQNIMFDKSLWVFTVTVCGAIAIIGIVLSLSASEAKKHFYVNVYQGLVLEHHIERLWSGRKIYVVKVRGNTLLNKMKEDVWLLPKREWDEEKYVVGKFVEYDDEYDDEDD